MNGDKGDKTLILPISLIPSYLHIPLTQFRILQVPHKIRLRVFELFILNFDI